MPFAGSVTEGDYSELRNTEERKDKEKCTITVYLVKICWDKLVFI